VRGRVVHRVAEAAEMLCSSGWPQQAKGPVYEQALVAHRNCIAGLAEPEVARAAFIAAAREAEVPIQGEAEG
jgi:Protein of unknown function (DUF982)